MRLIKMLGLAMVAAIAAMAFIGAGTASATVLCEVEAEETCPEESVYPAGTAIEAELEEETKSVLESEAVTIECQESTLVGETTSKGGGEGVPVEGEFTEVTWAECTSGLGKCTVKALELPWNWELNWTEKSDGQLFVFPFKKTFTCGFITCEFGAELEIKFKGGNNPSISATVSILVKISGFFCSAEAKWSAQFSVTIPKPVFVKNK